MNVLFCQSRPVYPYDFGVIYYDFLQKIRHSAIRVKTTIFINDKNVFCFFINSHVWHCFFQWQNGVKKHRTDQRSCLSDETLESLILVVKSRPHSFGKRKYSREALDTLKKAYYEQKKKNQ